jgi:hypothetical protein
MQITVQHGQVSANQTQLTQAQAALVFARWEHYRRW